MDVWSVTLMLDISTVARVEFIEHVNSKKLSACNSSLDIDRNKLARHAHSHAEYCYISRTSFIREPPIFTYMFSRRGYIQTS